MNYCNYPGCRRNCGFSLAGDKDFSKKKKPNPQNAHYTKL